MHGARSYDHHEAVVFATQNGADLVTTALNERCAGSTEWQLGGEIAWQWKRLEFSDPKILRRWMLDCPHGFPTFRREPISSANPPVNGERQERMFLPVGSGECGVRLRRPAPPEPTRNTHTSDYSWVDSSEQHAHPSNALPAPVPGSRRRRPPLTAARDTFSGV
jgi:hypothetical protein